MGSVKLSDRLPPGLRGLAKRAGLEASRLRLAFRDAMLRALLLAERGVRHVDGPTELDAGPEELVVVTMVRDAEPWLPTYLSHYRRLGAAHVVMLDNGSSDGTVEIGRSCDDVTVLSTSLPYAPYFVVLKRWLVRRFGRGCWTLVADADELFDYPFSRRLDLRSFLRYLNRHGYTAVTAQNLEMVAPEPLASVQGRREEDLEELYRFYDISDIERSKDKYWVHMNDGAVDAQYSHTGGIRRSVFGWTGSMLTKQPLLRHDGRMNVFPYDGHFVTNARLADVSGVFRHYKFIGSFYEHVEREIEKEAHYDDARIFKRYEEVIEDDPELDLCGPEARRYRAAEDLLESGFLVASDRFRAWVRERGGEAASAPGERTGSAGDVRRPEGRERP